METIAMGEIPIAFAVVENMLWAAVFLPGIGAVMCIISLFAWRQLGKLRRVLSIFTIAMCNPIFYYLYVLAISFTGAALESLIVN